MPDSDSTIPARTGFWLLIGLIVLVAAGKPVLYDTLDPDCFWHLRVAAQLHRDGIGPIVDDLSFASSKTPWTPYSWLAEWGMKAIWDMGGFRAAVAVTALMQGAIIFLLAMTCVDVQRGRPKYLATAVAVAIGAYFTLPYLSFRPVTMGFVLLFAIAWLIARDQNQSPQSRWALWTPLTIVGLTFVLTNIHLFSFFVPAMIFAFAIGAAIERNRKNARRYAILATVTMFACMATPMLPGLLKTIFYYSTRDKMITGPVIAEMQHIGLTSAIGVAAILACIAFHYRSVGIGHLICIAAATLLLAKLGRFAPLFCLAACPALAATLPGLKDRLLAKPPVIALLAVIASMGLVRIVRSFPGHAVTVSQWVNRHGKDTPGYPCAAADYVCNSIPRDTGHLINEFSWGGYLAWRLDNKFQILMDGRTQVYPQSLWQATYLGSDQNRLQFLSKVSADAALVPIGNSKFRGALIQLGWQPVFRDERAEVLVPPSSVMARTEQLQY